MNDVKKFEVVIVGAGAAGLAAAAYLCRYGHRVLLCERSGNIGGLVTSFKHNDFVFDGGIRAFENSGIIKPMLKQLEISMDFVENPVSIRIEYDTIQIESTSSLHDYNELLCRTFPNNRKEIERIVDEIKTVMGYMDVFYGIDNPMFMEAMPKDREYLLKTLLPWLLKYQKNINKAAALSQPINEYLEKFTDNRSLIDMITQHFFKNTPAFFALSYFGQYCDYFYPLGGTGVLADKLCDYIGKSGGIILKDTGITDVDTARQEVKSDDGRVFGYKKLIWACDTGQLCSALHPNDYAKSKKATAWRELVRKNHGGDSVFSVFIGVDMDSSCFLGHCAPHCFYTPDKLGLRTATDTDESSETDIDRIVRFLKYTTYEISCPVLRDPSLAPKGKTGLIVSTVMDYTIVSKICSAGKYEEFKRRCTETIIDLIDRRLMPGLRDKIIFSICSTPLTIKDIAGSAEGAIAGWAFSGERLPSETRFKRISKSILTPFDNIYQAGQWAFSPSGVPTCFLTGKLAADETNKRLIKEC